jgi:hypothetical protein
MKRTLAGIILVLGILFIGAQFLRPKLPSRAPAPQLQAPPEVQAILKKSCYSCHANSEPLPLADNVVPAYWLVAHDILEAQQHLNFAELATKPAAAQRAELFEAVNQIQLGAMPLPRYLAAHHGAAITPAELTTLKTWLAQPPATPAPPIDINAAAAQYATWSTSPHAPTAPSPNGLTIPADYRDWQPISSTDRWDNGTLRQILGNPIAIKALAEGHINPWPDGTTFAKVAWITTPDGNGGVRAGEFKQVEFMIRDEQKYKSTAGWGWARWLGPSLKPYGKDANLATECVGCHLPVKNDDYVYTMPLKGAR